jgi:uncharacterized protein YlxP (DUF503 family)
MQVTLLVIEVMLEGCRSLKEKRHRTRKFREKWGRRQNVAVIESGQQDQQQFCEWSLVVIADSRKRLHQLIEQIETELETELDGIVTGITREQL